MKLIYLAAIMLFVACNSGETGTETGSGSADSGTTAVDTPGDTRGMKGTGVDNTGGTPGPGTITDTLGGKVDTADHTSKRKN
jgi:hypothetical protein